VNRHCYGFAAIKWQQNNYSHAMTRSRATTNARLDRLERLAACLADGDAHAISALAAQLGVSIRTMSRDIDLLRERGLAIEGEAGRGGGIALANRWPVSVPLLREQDAIDLLLALAASEALGLSRQQRLAPLRERITRSFAPADRASIARLRQRIRVAAPALSLAASDNEAWNSATADIIKQAFFQRRQLTIDYRDGHNRRSTRTVEPQCLLCAWPLWYLLAWDIEKHAARTFRIDRVGRAHLLDAVFTLRPASVFWEACSDIGISL
jgi:predicted DNA-binding transcriptional regulator YafY